MAECKALVYRAVLYSFLLWGLSLPVHASGVTYHWVDEQGNTRFSDAMPGHAATHGYRVIDPSTGKVIREVERAKTPEERELARLEAERAEHEAALSESQRRADEQLLKMYGSEESLLEARNRHLSSIDARIERNQQAAERMNRLIEEHPNSSQAYQRDLHNLQSHIQVLRAERDELAQHFSDQLTRYRLLQQSAAD